MKIFIDVSPAFYKTKLFVELYKQMDILVVYTTDYNISSRNKDFLNGERSYPFIDLKGSKLIQTLKIFWLLFNTKYDEVISGGYTSIATWIPILFFTKRKNAVIVESTFRETKPNGISALLKRFLFSRVNRAYVCGSPHEKLARMFGFRGEVIHFKSVGLFNIVKQPQFIPRAEVKKFLFVGRLIPVKNLEWLIARFMEHPELQLIIVGFGALNDKLTMMIKDFPNIIMCGAVDNIDLPKFYQQADVFILPSITETWGLVVEEALNNGTPIMCSHMVGSSDDLVIAKDTGVVFELNNISDFNLKLKLICTLPIYNRFRKNISQMDFVEYEKQVIESFKN